MIDDLPELQKLLAEQLRQHGLLSYSRQITAIAEPTILLKTIPVDLNFDAEEAVKAMDPDFDGGLLMADEMWNQWQMDKYPIGASRLGGRPDLPEQVAWPANSRDEKLPFVAQLECGSLPSIPTLPLPRSGWLYFFAQNDDAEFPLPNRVIHWEGNGKSLKRAPASAAKELAPSMTGRRLFSFVPIVEASLWPALPAYGEPPWQQLKFNDAQAEERFTELAAGRYQCAARLFGFGGDSGLTPSQIVRDRGLEGDDWMLLLQIHRNNGQDWLGDGTLQMFIRQSDLLRSNFSRCYADVEAS